MGQMISPGNGSYTTYKILTSDIKIIRTDPLAPVKTTALLLSVEWKMPDSICSNENLEPSCNIRKRNQSFGYGNRISFNFGLKTSFETS